MRPTSLPGHCRSAGNALESFATARFETWPSVAKNRPSLVVVDNGGSR